MFRSLHLFVVLPVSLPTAPRFQSRPFTKSSSACPFCVFLKRRICLRLFALLDRISAARTLAAFGHSEVQVGPNMHHLHTKKASAFLSGTWSAELAGVIEPLRGSGRQLSVGSSPGRKTTSRQYVLTLNTRTGPDYCGLVGSIAAADKDSNPDGLTFGTVTGTYSDSSLALLIQWRRNPSGAEVTSPDAAAPAEAAVSTLAGCTMLHAVYGHRPDSQFCIGDRVRIIRRHGPKLSNDQGIDLQGEIIDSSVHSTKFTARKSDDSHGLAGTPQFLVQINRNYHEDYRSDDKIEEVQTGASTDVRRSLPTWHTADELAHAEHIVELVG
eukprot:COSAG02_NODE_7629_length_2926_cov_1.765830_2_plen_325_part_01